MLEILNDGQWHTIEEVRQKMKLNENQIRQVTDFLSEYEFVAVDNTESKLKIKDTVRRFLSQTATS